MKGYKANLCPIWRAAGVVERGRLEICCTLRGTGGSNPSLSASMYSPPVVVIHILNDICKYEESTYM